jgi:hypothetical protein
LSFLRTSAEELGVWSTVMDADMAGNQIVLEFQQLRLADLGEVYPVPGQITGEEPVLAVVRILTLGNVALDTNRNSALADVDEACSV